MTLLARSGLVLGATGLVVATFLSWFPAGIEGAYLNRSIGAPAYSGVVTTWEARTNLWHWSWIVGVLTVSIAASAFAAALLRRRALTLATFGGALALAIYTLVLALDPPVEWFGGFLGPGSVLAFGSLVLIAAAAASTVVSQGRGRGERR